jgi:hypothetical protein
MVGELRLAAFEREMDGGRKDRVFVVFDAGEQAAKRRGDGQRDDGDGNDGEAEPEKEGVPLPLPELAGEGDGIGAGGVDEGSEGEGDGGRVEDDVAEADEGNDEQEFERVDEVVGQLRGGDVEAEQKGGGKGEEGGAAENGIDADEQADCDAPGQLLRRGPHAQKCEDGKGDAPVDPVVVERVLLLRGTGEIRFAGVHY